MTPYADLLARLEAATEGSRELDAIIWVEIVQGQPPIGNYATGIANADLAAQDEGKEFCAVPRFTESLDAALTLVPEGWHLDLHDWTWAEEPKWNASLQRCQGVYEKVNGLSPTSAPLAVTIAALRARHSFWNDAGFKWVSAI